MSTVIERPAAKTTGKQGGKKQIPDVEVLIIGAGFSGIGAAIKLLENKMTNFTILEQADDLGGTWRDNTYPGVAVDISSFVYSYSFEQRPDWSRVYAPGKELKEYADHCATKYGVRSHIQYNKHVEKAEFDEEFNYWRVYTTDGKVHSGRFLVSATGGLTQPKMPDIPGLETFKGKKMHTARWDHKHNLKGERVAIIGTGATAVQVVPSIAPDVAQLDVYQRTPIWVTPKPDAVIPKWMQWAFDNIPFVQRGTRWSMYNLTEMIMVTGAVYNRQMPWLVDYFQKLCLKHLENQVPDPELRKKLTPNYDFACKRPSFSNDYWSSFMRDNVELITDSIECITENGIRTVDGKEREVDTLILSTGFKVFERGNLPTYPLLGRGGVALDDFWFENRFQAYEGITIPGYPNFFTMLGPYAFIATSFFATMEANSVHLMRCIKEAHKRNATCIEVKEKANADYFQDILKRQESTVFFNSDCTHSNSYYFNEHGDAPLMRPSSTLELHLRSHFFNIDDYAFSS